MSANAAAIEAHENGGAREERGCKTEAVARYAASVKTPRAVPWKIWSGAAW
jgi:hypothetical protein